MIAIEISIIIAVSAFVVGSVLGTLLGPKFMPSSEHQKLASDLENTKTELNDYKSSVAKHFAETSQRVGEFTQSYINLHEQLSRGAIALADKDVSEQMLEASRKTPLENQTEYANSKDDESQTKNDDIENAQNSTEQEHNTEQEDSHLSDNGAQDTREEPEAAEPESHDNKGNYVNSETTEPTEIENNATPAQKRKETSTV